MVNNNAYDNKEYKLLVPLVINKEQICEELKRIVLADKEKIKEFERIVKKDGDIAEINYSSKKHFNYVK